MTMMPGLETMAFYGDTGSCHDFPRLTRESGFTFNLYRGRVDWKNIESIDVDRLIRERDLETLQGAFSSIVSCSLDSEYDLKVLDPNFVKLFRLAQLAVDYLQYCRRYLDHCIIAIQEQLRVALQEVEELQKDKRKKNEELHLMHKKLKAQVKARSASVGEVYKCSFCGKIFVTEEFLKAHITRRHSHFVQPSSDNHQQDIQRLQRQFEQLQERLQCSEGALLLNQRTASPDIAVLKNVLQSELQKLKQSNCLSQELYTSDNQKGSQSQEQERLNLQSQNQSFVKHLPEEGSNSHVEVMTSAQQLRTPAEIQCDHSGLLDRIQHQSEEIRALRDQLLQQQSIQEQLWQQKLEQIQRLHHSDLEELRSSLSVARVTGLGGNFTQPHEALSNTYSLSKQHQTSNNTHILQMDSPLHPHQAWSGEVQSDGVMQQSPQLSNEGPWKLPQQPPQKLPQQTPQKPPEEVPQQPPQKIPEEPPQPRPQEAPPQQSLQQPPQQQSPHKHYQELQQQSQQQPQQQSQLKHFAERAQPSQHCEHSKLSLQPKKSQEVQQQHVQPQHSYVSKALSTVKVKSEVQTHKASKIKMSKGEISCSVTPLREQEDLSSLTESSARSTGSSESSQSLEENPTLESMNNASGVELDSSSKMQRKVSMPKNSMYRQATESSESESEANSSSYTTTVLSDTEAQSPSSEKTSDSARVELSPQVLAGLKEDLQLLLERRLRELGVDPEWDGLPAVTFRNNMAILQHQQNITAKSFKSYFRIREDISREVEKRIIEHGKKHQPTENSITHGSEKGSEKKSKSLLARFKSSVKSKLYSQPQSSHSSVNSVISDGTFKSSKKIKMKENPYSSEYSRKNEAKESSCEPETLSDRPTSDLSSSNHEQEKMKETKTVAMRDVLEPQQTYVLLKPESSKSIELSESQMHSNILTGRVLGERSVSIIQEKSVVDIESHVQSVEIRTSTPINSQESHMKDELGERGFKNDNVISSKSTLHMDSGSELESDVNDILETTQNISRTPPKTHPRTSLTTAELLADVARLRQSGFPAMSSAVKSNLKSSSSTGNIKKRVVFQDEQDGKFNTKGDHLHHSQYLEEGFNTIELGPAHGPSSLPLPQRSLSVSSIIMSSSSSHSSQFPIPQPRSSAVIVSHATDTNTDSDWDKDSMDLPTQGKLSAVKPALTSAFIKDLSDNQFSDVRGNSGQEKWNTGSTNFSTVSDIAKDIERQLQHRQGKPSLGIDTTGLVESPKPSVFFKNPMTKPTDQENDINLSNLTVPSSSGLQKMYSTVGDSLESILDDLSSG